MTCLKRVESRSSYPIDCGRGMAYSSLIELVRARSSEHPVKVAVVTDKEVNCLHKKFILLYT